MPRRTLPSRQAGACGSGTGSGRYSSLLSKSRIEVSEAVIFQLRSLHSIESLQYPQILLCDNIVPLLEKPACLLPRGSSSMSFMFRQLLGFTFAMIVLT